jgi:eukaryotic-like serine/threonine-protein kinase
VDGAGRLIWIHDLQRGVRTLVSERGSLADGPVWSANGEALYSNANLDGIWKIYRKTATGSGAPDLVGIPAGARDVSVLDASRDGRYLLATAVAGSESWDLYLLPLDRPEAGWTAWASTPGAENSGRFSPDSRWIAYASTVSGVSEIYVSAVDDPWNRWQISSNGGLEPVWAAEGRRILYRTPADRLMAVDVELSAQGVRPGPPQSLFELHSVGDWSPRNVFDVMPDGTLLVVRRPAAYDATIHVRTAVPLGR